MKRPWKCRFGFHDWQQVRSLITIHTAFCSRCEGRLIVSLFGDFIDYPAQGTEARRAETGTGSVHDGPVPQACAPASIEGPPRMTENLLPVTEADRALYVEMFYAVDRQREYAIAGNLDTLPELQAIAKSRMMAMEEAAKVNDAWADERERELPDMNPDSPAAAEGRVRINILRRAAQAIRTQLKDQNNG